MRYRLIELINQKQIYGIDQEQPRKSDLQLLDNEELADHLLSEGVIVPPVKVGGTVYTLNRGKVKEWKVCFIGQNTREEIKFHLADEGFKTMIEAWNYDIGRTVFLTKSQAEQALRKGAEG